ncbi:MSC_0620 family F1-like ATPase-associated subunit [Mycoplasma sp. 'Moose RK']|uniref:MSC_0620 family F1-like ATPase-associated subunit n=1 Tax=Mycoplasma sp. 'Moose RK' TaxID=2780095 RepID=UPI0018C28AF7|nr:hypothetical protein [Mycoplasma sp. 'Moose RK']MBG0730854.1 hypothetical protein [Mycoplasma sp. 'Moose RK']
MVNKKRKKLKKALIFLLFSPIISLSPLAFLSSGIQLTQEQPSEGSSSSSDSSGSTTTSPSSENGGSEASKPSSEEPGKSIAPKKADPINDDDLKKNKDWWNVQKSYLIDNFITKVIDDIKIKLADIASKTGGNLEERLQQSFFWIQLKYYFTKNQQAIKQDPKKFGLNIITPYAFANNLKLKRGDVSFEKESYKGLEWGSNDDDNYEKISGVKTEKITEVPNTLKGADFEKRIKTYFQGLESGYKQYLFKEDEFPVYKKNFDLNLNSDKVDSDENLLLFSKPKGVEGKNINSWDDWIKKYFEKQSLLLDFSLNQLPNPSSSQSAQEQINLAIKKITNQNPPDVAQKPEFEVRIAPDLPPIVAPEYALLSNQNVVDLFNASTTSAEEKQKIFFFLNPLNSRFKYNIQSVSIGDGGKIKATVKITDFVNKVRESTDKTKFEKVYETDYYTDFPNDATPEQKQAITANLYHSNLGVTAVIDEFFATINVKDQFTFDQIRYYSSGSQATIYNFFYLITKVFYNQDFLDAQKKLAADYVGSSFSTVFSASQFQFLAYLKKSEIDNNKAWAHYYLIYFLNLIVLQDLFVPRGDKEEQAKKQKLIDENLQKLNITREDINRFFAQAHQKVALFHNESYKLSSNLVTSFLAMTKLGRKINQLNQILGQVVYFGQEDKNKQPNSGSDEDPKKKIDPVQNFADLIQEYNSQNASEWMSDNLGYFAVGVVTFLLVSTAIVTRLVVYKRKAQINSIEGEK